MDNKIVEGFSLPIKPNTYGINYKFPEDATQLTIEEIGQWMSKLASYRGYSYALYIRYEVMRRMIEENYKLVLAVESSKVSGKTNKDKTNQAMTSEEVQEISEKLLKMEKNTIFTKGLSEVYSGQIEALSRELTRRKIVMEMQ